MAHRSFTTQGVLHELQSAAANLPHDGSALLFHLVQPKRGTTAEDAYLRVFGEGTTKVESHLLLYVSLPHKGINLVRCLRNVLRIGGQAATFSLIFPYLSSSFLLFRPKDVLP